MNKLRRSFLSRRIPRQGPPFASYRLQVSVDSAACLHPLPLGERHVGRPNSGDCRHVLRLLLHHLPAARPCWERGLLLSQSYEEKSMEFQMVRVLQLLQFERSTLGYSKSSDLRFQEPRQVAAGFGSDSRA